MRVVKEGEKPITFKQGQPVLLQKAIVNSQREGVVETLLNPANATRFIVVIFPNGERSAFRYDELLPVKQETLQENRIPGVIDPVLSRITEPLL